MKEKKMPNISIGTYLKGYLEYTPPGYDPGGAQTYPLIIFFHGVGEVGPGTSSSLCSILTLLSNGTDNNTNDVPLPERIERGELPTVSSGGNSYNYIVLSPQYNQYDFGNNAYPSAPDVEAMIDYAVGHYKVDVNRIYLTGMSSGSNMVMEYVGSSASRANRVAAIAMASECSSVRNFPNGPSYIAAANLPVWEVHCTNDDNGFCQDSISSNWINAINAQSTPPNPLAKKTTLPITGWPCNTGFTHNTWNTLYNPAFTDGGPNVYNWLIQFSNAASLPANIKDYSVRLDKSKVIVEWTTMNESNTDRFILERSGVDQHFQAISQVAAAGYSAVDRKYALVDEQPLSGTNYYRLSLVNKDRAQEFYTIKKLNNPTSWAGKVNIPNPARGNLFIYLNMENKENIQIQVFDLNGRLLKEVKKVVYAGTSSQSIDVSAFSHGTYMVRVSGETIAVNRTIIVN
jgi:predicted esterase